MCIIVQGNIAVTDKWQQEIQHPFIQLRSQTTWEVRDLSKSVEPESTLPFQLIQIAYFSLFINSASKLSSKIFDFLSLWFEFSYSYFLISFFPFPSLYLLIFQIPSLWFPSIILLLQLCSLLYSFSVNINIFKANRNKYPIFLHSHKL